MLTAGGRDRGGLIGVHPEQHADELLPTREPAPAWCFARWAFTSPSNSRRGKTLSSWLKMEQNRFTGEPSFRVGRCSWLFILPYGNGSLGLKPAASRG